ncbi:DUF362 domain-containing protein [Candidatus Neomarinimicrobiota bacterium]
MMSEDITRRSFIKKSAKIAVGSVLAGNLLADFSYAGPASEIVVVTGSDYQANTQKAVALIGGMERYVPKNSKVAILANPQSNNPGTYTKPEIVRAVIQMCKAAGASKISCIGWLTLRDWRTTGLKDVIDSEGVKLEITNLRNESQFKRVAVPEGKALKEARIIKTFYNYDILININISKEHSGNNYSGALKNLMGINSPASDRTFHRRKSNMIAEDIEHLDQCIADLNTIIHPHLCIMDSTEFVITNGPMGPGKLLKPQKVVAGTDRVAVDAYCATLFGYDPQNILAIKKAYEHGLGEIDLKNVSIKEIFL